MALNGHGGRTDDDQPDLCRGGPREAVEGRPRRRASWPSWPSTRSRDAAVDAGRGARAVGRVDRGGVRRPDRQGGRRAAAPRARGRGTDAADDAEPARLPLVRRRGAIPAGHAGQHLQLVVPRGDPVPGQPRRGRDRGRGGQRVPRADPEGARGAARAQEDLRHQAAGRRTAEWCAASGRAARPGRPRSGRARRRDLPRRPGHPDLHVRHHRPAEGRHDQPVQRGVHGRAAPPVLRADSTSSASGRSRTYRWLTSPSG